MAISIMLVVMAVALGWAMRLRLGKQNYYREWWWAMLILFTGTLLCVGLVLRWPVPNPSDWIEMIFAPISSLFIHWVQ